jgi:hypothetical protein
MSLKTIKIEPEHLKVSNRKSKKKVPILSINEPNLRQALLNKLIQRRKTQKKSMVLPVNEGGFDDADNVKENICQPNLNDSKPVVNIQPVEIVNIVNPDKPYGVLKNGTKPTFKEWSLNNRDLNVQVCESFSEKVSEPDLEPILEPVLKSFSEPVGSVPFTEERSESLPITKKIRVGKNKRTKSVDVLIENIHTRKLNKDKFQLLKKTNISTIKNYLKNRQLIKVGSNAPNTLMRYMYENIKECGDVINDNKTNLLHNFTKDTN